MLWHKLLLSLFLSLLPALVTANAGFLSYCKSAATTNAKTTIGSLKLISARSTCEKISLWLENEENFIFSRVDLPDLEFLRFFKVRELRLRQTATKEFSALLGQAFLENLVLEGLKLDDDDIRILQKLPGLKKLEISHCGLENFVFAHGGLIELNLADNQLASIKLNTPGLNSLDLSRNHLKRAEELPTRLEHLEIAANQLKTLPSPIDQLKTLVADDNQLESIEGILRAQQLRELYTTGNRLKKFPDLSSLAELKILAISPGDQFGRPPRLETLYIDDTLIKR